MLGPSRRRVRQSRQSAPPPSLLPENIARGGAHSNSTVRRRGFFYFQWQISHAPPHISVKIKSRPSCIRVGPRIGQSRGEASVTPPGLAPLLELNARSPVAVDLDRTSLSLGG